LEAFSDDGTQWVPYVENGNGQGQNLQPAATANADANDRGGTAASPPGPPAASRGARVNRGG